MKYCVLTLVFFLVFSQSVYANWYIVNRQNQIVAICDYDPDRNDLDSRDEIAEYSNLDISIIEAEYRGNRIVKHVKTAVEIEKEKQALILQSFSAFDVKAQLFDTFEDQLTQFIAIYPFLSDMIKFKDFDRMKRYIDAVLAADAKMQPIYDSFITLIKENGIDLTEY